MISSAAHERLPMSSGNSPASAPLHSSRTMLTTGRLCSAVSGLLVAFSLSIAAQTPAPQITTPQIHAEFRTPARSLITHFIDRSRIVPVRGAVAREVAIAQDLGPHDPTALLEHIQLILQRPQERQAAFDAEIEALHQRGNPSYHQWLTPDAI